MVVADGLAKGELSGEVRVRMMETMVVGFRGFVCGRM